MATSTNTELNICKDTAYQNSILLKKRFQLKNVAPQRYDNLSNNPYTVQNSDNTFKYTQSQLDMRRKAEVLKYSASKTNTKTNNLTRAEKWRLLVNGYTQQPSQGFINMNTISQTIDPLSNLISSITIQTCPSGTIIQTPSYASGIPGQLTYLYLDPTIPLYNYSSVIDTYSILNAEKNTDEFTYDSGIDQLDNELFASPANNIIATSIYIINPVSEYRDFTIQFPVSLFIKGTVKSSVTNNSTNYYSRLKVKFSKLLSCSVQYGYNAVQNIECDVVFSGLKINKSLGDYVGFDISMVPNYSDPNNNSFYGDKYIGLCTLQNFRLVDSTGKTIQQGLTTLPGYIYDIQLNTIDSTGNSFYSYTELDPTVKYPNPDIIRDTYSTYFNKPSYGLIINVSQLTVNQTKNCSIYLSDNNPTIRFPSTSSISNITVI